MITLSEKIMSTEQVESETNYAFCEVDAFGDKRYYNKENQLHREDGPAIEWADGSKYWYTNNKLHRKGEPAIELANGEKFWHSNGEFMISMAENHHACRGG